MSLVDRWLGRQVSANTTRPRETHLGRNQLLRGEMHGPYWLPWCLNNGINPLGCESVFHGLERWGNELERLTRATSGRISPNYAANMWMSVRSWHRWLASPRGMGWECSAEELYAELPGWQFLHPTPVRARRTLALDDLGVLVRTADTVGGSAEVRLRNGALLALLVATGARMSEVQGILRRHLSLSNNRGEVTFQGKRGRWHTSLLPSWCTSRVSAYLDVRDAARPSPLLGEEPVLAPTKLRTSWRPLSATTLAHTVDDVVRRAVSDRVTSHGIRASLITGALARGHSVWDVAGWTGHESERSLRAYDRRRVADDVAAELHGAVQHAIEGR